MHLSKSKDRTRRPSPPPKTRRQPGCPAPQPKPSAVISAPDRIGPAAAVRGSRAGEPSCQPAPPAPKRPDRPTLQNIKDSERPIQSPGSAPLPQQSRRPPEPRPSQKPVGAAPSVRRRLRARKRSVNRKSATAPRHALSGMRSSDSASPWRAVMQRDIRLDVSPDRRQSRDRLRARRALCFVVRPAPPPPPPSAADVSTPASSDLPIMPTPHLGPLNQHKE
ncbi:hypothetical protein IHEIED_02134 [Methylorubrum populi]